VPCTIIVENSNVQVDNHVEALSVFLYILGILRQIQTLWRKHTKVMQEKDQFLSLLRDDSHENSFSQLPNISPE